MRHQARRWTLVALAVAVLCPSLLVVVVAALPGGTQPAADAPASLGPDQLHEQLLRQLAQVWSEMVQGAIQDPAFLDSPEAETLWERVELLGMVRREMMETMHPQAFEPGPENNGRYQFVEWIDPGQRYWVVDTRTGELQQREAPPIEG